MAQNLKNSTTIPSNQENDVLRPGKGAFQTKPARRPALGEVGNKLNEGQRLGGLKKIITTNVNKTTKNVSVVPKPTIAKQIINEPQNAETAQKVKKTIKIVPKTIVRTESLLNHKAVTQIENIIENKIKVPKEISYSTKQLEVADADAEDNNDPMLVSEYILDIFSYLRELELKHSIKKHFLVNSKSTPRMRSVLVDWMIDVHCNFKFLQETLHLSIGILDRYLQLTPNIGRDTLQLVGTTAMFIAGKYEEIYVPDISDFVHISDDSFSKRQIQAVESDILKKLHFELGKPLAIHFLRRYNKVAKVRPDHHTLGKYLLEIGLLEYELCHIRPSLQAAVACCLAISILDNKTNPSQVWTSTLVHYSKYEYSTIKPLLGDFAAALLKQQTSTYKSVITKYASPHLSKISSHPILKGSVVKALALTSTLFKK